MGLKEIVPVVHQNVEINAKTFDNALKAIDSIKELRKKSKTIPIFSKIEDYSDDPEFIKVDDEFEKVIYGVKKGVHRELWLDGFSNVADDIIRENKKKNVEEV